MGLESTSSIAPSEKSNTLEKTLSLESILSNEDYKIIESKMDEEFGRFGWGEYSRDFARPEINESEYLIKGTLRLIQKVMDADPPYDSIVFLDKSARPGAQIYRMMIAMLKDKGFIKQDIDFPEIKFMDVGKQNEDKKIKSDYTKEMFRNIVKPEYIGSNILIVDEFKDTGVTLSGAATELKSIFEGYSEKPLKIDTYYQFSESSGIAPFYYRDSYKLSGVRDAEMSFYLRGIDRALDENDENILRNYRVETVIDGIRRVEYVDLNTSLDELEALKTLAEKVHTREIYCRLFNWHNDGNISLDEAKKIIQSKLPNLDVNEIEDELKVVLQTKIRVQPESLFDYFRCAGGRLAAPVIDKRQFIIFRKMLNRLLQNVEERL
ncbi:hypothetical protein KA062_02015 [Patescibacteria group bacterium]|nr:hypothetical protein [Patescibacteria group bacterium]